jgi:CheY-like chemotaxis protein
LLADDSLTIQKVVNLTFSDEGFDVQTVGDGDSALAAISEFTPDIVLADVNMPGADGYSICEQLRSNELTNKIPVILLVGSFEPFDEEKAGFVGANAFLTKPFQSIRQLISQVNELLAAAPSTNGHSAPEQPSAEPPDDISDLYTQSFSADAAKDDEPNLEDSLSGYDDSGLDDEMIETSYLATDEKPETLDFEIVGNETPFVENEKAVEPEPQIDHDYEETPVATGCETSPLDPFSAPAEQKGFVSQSFPVEESINESESFADTVPNVDLGQIHTIAETPVEFAADESTGLDEFVSSEPSSFSEEDSQEPTSFEPPAPPRIFEELDLLDIPSMDSNKTVELTTVERAELMGSEKQAVSVSPELMELIVQQVVEKMSQKY